MIIFTLSLMNSPVLPTFKRGKNQFCLRVDYCNNVNAIVTSVKVPIASLIKIIDSILPATGKYSTVIDLAIWLMSMKIAFQMQFATVF